MTTATAATRWAKDRGERLVASPIPETDVSGKRGFGASGYFEQHRS